MLRLSTIIVSYNVRDLLRDCLRSVFASAAHSADWLHVDMIVVDNASHDGSAEMVAAEFPQVTLIASETNLGFTGGNNRALAELGMADCERRGAMQSPVPNPQSPDFVLLLNPDTELVDDALGQMVRCLMERPRWSVWRAATLRQWTVPTRRVSVPVSGAGGVGRAAVGRDPRCAALFAALAGQHAERTLSPIDLAGDLPFPVDFVLGAALMVRTEAIRQVGLLDDGYFMYCEEMDWCLRLQQAGWAVYAAPSALVIHHEGQSSKQVRWATLQRIWRSRFRFYHKHGDRYPGWYVHAVRVLVWAGLSARGRLARRRFARGEINGAALGDELSTYAQILKKSAEKC
ncbi:MAG: glycosyltransferase family 2 protein [Caldilineaceae bacterium]